MKNLDNPLRKYNKDVLHRTRMHLYTKKHIDVLTHKAIALRPRINLVKLSEEDIIKFKSLKCNEEHFEAYLLEKHSYEPPQKIIIKEFDDKKKPDVLKLVLSREGETDKFKSKFKSTLQVEENVSATSVIESQPMEITCEEQSKSTEESSKSTEESLKSTEEPLKSTEEPLKSKEESFKSTEESLGPPNKTMVGTIKVVNLNALMDEEKYKAYCANFLGIKPDSPKSVNGLKNVIVSSNVVMPSTNTTPPLCKTGNVVKENVSSLAEIQILYNKYFSKSIQDSIVIIANILNIISMSNKHHKARMDESFKKKTEAEKLKERCDANRMHVRHKKVLEAKLKKNFVDVISSFEDSEFECTFQMFFLSILTVLRVLDQPKFKKGSIFKNLVLLLWNSLKNTEFDHPKVFTMFRSKAFRPNCIDLISLIEDSRDSDPGITDRMALFFVSTVNSQEHFKYVISAVTSDSNEDLGILIDNASFQCRINSKFKDPTHYTSSPMKKSINEKTLTSIQNTVMRDDGVQHWVIAQTSSGPYQSIPKINEKLQKTGNITLEASTSQQPLNTFYETFSNSLIRVSSESIPKSIAPKVSVVASSSVAASTSLGQATPFLAFKPANMKPIVTTALQRTEGNTIVLNNKQYHIIRRPMNQGKAVATNQTPNIFIRPNSAEVSIQCFAANCTNPATIMCSSCTSVKYCSQECQKLDWYDSHIRHCEQLLKKRTNSN